MLGKLRRYVRNLRNLNALARRSESLEAELGGLRELLDYEAARATTPRAWVDEFQAWRSSHPLPAEPLVSVCLPTYNRAKLLVERCLPSLLQQTYSRLEIVVVGDGCTDDTEDRIRRLADQRIRFLNLPERGRYPSDPRRRWMVAGTTPMNKAMELAQGDFITHLDDDDEHLPARTEKLVDFAKQKQLDLVWHPFHWEIEPGHWIVNEARNFSFGQVSTSSVFYRSWLKRVEWDLDAHLVGTPGDWHRFRRIRYLAPASDRHPELLLRHYCERRNA